MKTKKQRVRSMEEAHDIMVGGGWTLEATGLDGSWRKYSRLNQMSDPWVQDWFVVNQDTIETDLFEAATKWNR